MVGLGHELLTAIVRFTPITLSTLDPVSSVAERHDCDFQVRTDVILITSSLVTILFKIEPMVGLEPTTLDLRYRCSTN